MGYLELKKIGWDTYEISFTEKGKSFFTQEKETLWKVEICKKVFVEVTGIIKTENHAEVKYTWKYDNFSSLFQFVKPIAYFGSIMFSSRERMYFSDKHLKKHSKKPYSLYEETCIMRKYDDGWRVEK